MKKIEITTKHRDQLINVTAAVQQAVTQLGVSFGTVAVCTPHTTCGITLNENVDPDVCQDLLNFLDQIMPWSSRAYKHRGGNTAAHVKSSLIGSSVTLIVDAGKIQLGTWQAIYLCEFDGPRARAVWVG